MQNQPQIKIQHDPARPRRLSTARWAVRHELEAEGDLAQRTIAQMVNSILEGIQEWEMTNGRAVKLVDLTTAVVRGVTLPVQDGRLICRCKQYNGRVYVSHGRALCWHTIAYSIEAHAARLGRMEGERVRGMISDAEYIATLGKVAVSEPSNF